MCYIIHYLCSWFNEHYFSDVEEEIFLSNCSSFSGIKYTFKAVWKSFLILYSLHGSQNYKPIACICLVLAFIASIIGISIIYDLDPFTDKLPYNPGDLALEWPQTITSYKLYTFITCIFIHINAIHLINNTALLLFCGFYLEVKYGWGYFLAIFFTSAIFGEFGQFFMNTIGTPFPWTSSHAIYVGSSTGVMGVMGVFVAETFIAAAIDSNIIKHIHFKYVSTFLLLAAFIAEVIYGIWYEGGVAVWMHIYGFAFGFMVLSAAISAKIFIGQFQGENWPHYMEINDLKFLEMQEITVEDIESSEITLGQKSTCYREQGDWAQDELNTQNTQNTQYLQYSPNTHKNKSCCEFCFCKNILFLAHFSLAIIYFTFVAFSIWRVFTF